MTQDSDPAGDDQTPEQKLERARQDQAKLTAKIDALDEEVNPKPPKVPSVGSMF